MCFLKEKFMESKIRPDSFESYTISGILQYAINIDVVETENGYRWEQVHVTKRNWEYGKIVDALISHKYPIDKMQAVVNNYLLEPENPEYITAFNEMQAWRKEAKEIAKEALTYELP